MSKVEAIFSATPKDGKPIWDNRVDFEKYMQESEGIELHFEVRQAAKLSEKERMYAFLFGPLMHCAMYALTQAGYENMDKTKARYKFQAEHAKADMIGPNGVETYMLDISGMSKARLLQFIQDIIWDLEMNYKQRVPDSAEYKAMKAGTDFVSVKHKKKLEERSAPVADEQKHACESCGGDFPIEQIVPSWDPELNGGQGASVTLCTTCYSEIYPEDETPK